MNEQVSVLNGIAWALQRDLEIALRSRGEVILAIIFYLIAASLFPLGIGAEQRLLVSVAAGVIWVCALLASLLALPRLFAADYADGTMEQWLLSPYPIYSLISGKLLAHWFSTGLPLVLLSPLLGLQFGLQFDDLMVLFFSLLLGTPTLSLIGAIGATLTLGLRAAPALLALLVLPLYVPVLIFGTGAVEAHLSGLSSVGHFSLLGAGLLLALLGAPLAISVALKTAIE